MAITPKEVAYARLLFGWREGTVRLGDSIRHGVAWLLIGRTGSRVLNFVFGIVLARLLAPEVFGMLVSIQIYTGLAGFVAGGGMGQALVQAKEVGEEDYDIVFTLQLAIGGVIYAGFFVLAPWLASWYKAPIYVDLLRVSALSFLLRPFVNLPRSILFRQMRFKEQVRVGVGTMCVSNAISISMAFFGFGVWSLIAGGLSGPLVGAALFIPIAGWRPRLSFRWGRGREIARYGVLVTVGDFIVYLREQGANFVLSKTLGPHAVGLFNKANSLALIPQTITGSVYQVSFRAMAKEQDNLDRSQYLYLRSITLVSVYTWPAFLALGWLSAPLVRFLYGVNWENAAYPLTCVAIIGPFLMLDMLAGSVLAARNWLRREIPVQVAMLLVVLLGAVAGLPYGLLGVAVGASLANVYGALHMSWLAARCLSIPIRRLVCAIVAPLKLNLPVLAVWFAMDHMLMLRERCGDFVYLVSMLSAGGLVFGLLFLFAPIPSIVSERQRWLNALKRSFPRNRHA